MNHRRLAIMSFLDSRKKFTARELAERFDVSVRTIQRDLDQLQRMGVPLYAEAGAAGGYSVLPNRILPPLQLTQHEALGMFLMIRYLEGIADFPFGAVRSRLAEQYFAALPKDVQDLIASVGDRVAFVQSHLSEADSSATTSVVHAAVENREIEFDYASKGGNAQVAAVPIGLYYENGYWYMPAKQGERIRIFRVIRMKIMRIREASGSSAPTLKEWFRSEDRRASVEAVITFTPFGERLASSDPLFRGTSNGEWRGMVPLEELAFMARKLLTFGPEAAAIEPAALKEQVMELLRASLRQYNPE